VSCVAAVRGALEACQGTRNVQVDFDKKQATVELQKGIDPATLVDALAAAGYEAKIAATD